MSKSEYVNSQIVISYKTNKVDLERMGNEMINRFSCHNFRNINADNLEFEKINILLDSKKFWQSDSRMISDWI